MPHTYTDALTQHAFNPSLPARDVQVGVTMVGGGALAIYENGPTQELFSLVQGHGVYGLIKRLTHSHVYVDVLSGTSAGGINTVFLSTALAGGKDVWPTRDIWVRLGNIDKLLQDPGYTEPAALFHGTRYFLPELEQAVDTLWKTPVRKSAGIPSGISPDHGDAYTDLDLFVTGSLLESLPRAFYDARNRPILSNTYNGVFHLRHRPGRGDHGESHLNPWMEELEPPFPHPEQPGRDRKAHVRDRLARIARGTASLPFIFEPTKFTRDLLHGVAELPRETSYVGDGGYLNGRPLDLVLAEIIRRPAERETVRKVFLVDPVPDTPDPTEAEKSTPTTGSDGGPPNALEHLALFEAIRGSQSAAPYLSEVYDHNLRVRRVTEALDVGLQLVKEAKKPLTEGQQVLWRRLRAQTLRDAVVSRWEAQLGLEGYGGVLPVRSPTTTEDQVSLRDAAEGLRRVRTPLLERISRHFDADNREESEPVLADHDPSLLRRKVRRLATLVTRELTVTEEENIRTSAEQEEQVRDLLRALHHLERLAATAEEGLLEALAELVRTDEYAAAASPGAEETGAVDTLWSLVLQRARHLLQPVPHLAPGDALASPDEEVRALRCVLRKRREPACPGDASTTLVTQLEQRLAALAYQAAMIGPAWRPLERPGGKLAWLLREPDAEAAGARMDPLEWLDVFVFPIEHTAELQCPVPIELVQISTRDVRSGYADQTADRKVVGESLGRLGGFFRRSWRVNDVMWGRLDASGAIVENLLEPERVRRVVLSAPNPEATAADMLTAVRGYLFTGQPAAPGEDPDAIGEFLQAQPHFERDLARIGEWLLHPVVPDAAPEAARGLESLRTWLLRRHQLEILVEELPNAVGEAVDEFPNTWRDPEGPPAETLWAWSNPDLKRNRGVPARHPLYPILSEWAARKQQAGADAVHRLLPEEVLRKASPELVRAVDAYFRAGGGSGAGGYRIGEEALPRDVPRETVRERLATAVSVSGNVVRTSLDQGKPLPRLAVTGISWLLQGLNLVGQWLIDTKIDSTAWGKARRVGLLLMGGAGLWLILQLLPQMAVWVLERNFGWWGHLALLVGQCLLFTLAVGGLGLLLLQSFQQGVAQLWKLGLLALGFLVVSGSTARLIGTPRSQGWVGWVLDNPVALWLIIGAALALFFAQTTVAGKVRILAVEMAGKRERLARMMTGWTAAERQGVKWSLWLDFLFIVTYVFLFGAACLAGGRIWSDSVPSTVHLDVRMAPWPDWPGWLARLGAEWPVPAWIKPTFLWFGLLLSAGLWFAALLDVVENVMLLQALKAVERLPEGAAADEARVREAIPAKAAETATWCARLKFLIITLALVYWLSALGGLATHLLK